MSPFRPWTLAIPMMVSVVMQIVVVVDAVSPPGPPAPPVAPGHGGVNCPTGSNGKYSNGQFWFQCGGDKKDGSQVIGCSYKDDKGIDQLCGKDQTYRNDQNVVQCVYDRSADTWTSTPVGCLTSGSSKSQRNVGEQWDEGEQISGDSRIKYRMTCLQDGFKVYKKATQCVYGPPETAIDAGCMKKIGDVLVQCVERRSGNNAQLRAQIVIAADQSVEQEAIRNGLKMC